jgi:hypothetical protein
VQVAAIKSELPGGVPFDLAAPVQGHYGAMRNSGAEGSTYLHTQLMQVLLLPSLGVKVACTSTELAAVSSEAPAGPVQACHCWVQHVAEAL